MTNEEIELIKKQARTDFARKGGSTHSNKHMAALGEKARNSPKWRKAIDKRWKEYRKAKLGINSTIQSDKL